MTVHAIGLWILGSERHAFRRTVLRGGYEEEKRLFFFGGVEKFGLIFRQRKLRLLPVNREAKSIWQGPTDTMSDRYSFNCGLYERLQRASYGLSTTCLRHAAGAI